MPPYKAVLKNELKTTLVFLASRGFKSSMHLFTFRGHAFITSSSHYYNNVNCKAFLRYIVNMPGNVQR